ncbi:hypothetical protein ACFV6E_30215 [Streptomyces sp. NPDC059785]|uniref:hypothetical protein n=1 Tax=unclassified Streptomyces TaxID=2593676 RepID=UPI00364654C6
MTTNNIQEPGDSGAETQGRGRQLATPATQGSQVPQETRAMPESQAARTSLETRATQAEPATGWTQDQIKGLIAALNNLPRRLARQELGADERLHTPQFDAFYAALHGAADAINQRTVTLRTPVTSAYWSTDSYDETKAIVDTRLTDQTPSALNSVTSINLQVGGQSYTWDPSKPHPVYPRLNGSHLEMEVPVPAGTGPFPVNGTVTYKDRDGGDHTYNVFPADADVPHRRLTVLP